ncbi:preprotein translocase subunit SecG [Vandammella animalimorsus]|uniref:Protein-export membrane protein SecG n=1 Tax=Vandammella animalimorsus TaxID=2029117 RepID=A0A2A2T5N7_9BURK|nr:preprotein translocase subunit SecG [Vandammella animalimorsus]PAT32516.1 preprotein translocase subunit SecG [Vandammella animalimorsus]PAX16900.1 preprotein translocase subunit SecG [Vandammella animalimorsus]PAX20301.1 preprotein translocase subunit SecG [Vandammella animalimorsus]
MSMTMTLVLMVQILAALVMAGLILLQHGKGADMGAAFGSGSSGSLFGATGGANFLSRMTALCATVFFAATLVLAYLGSQGMQRPADESGSSVLDSLPASSAPAPLPESGPAAAIPGASAPAPAAASNAAAAGATGANAIPDATPATPAPTPTASESAPASAVAPASAEAPAAAQPAAGEAAASNAAQANQGAAPSTATTDGSNQ